MIISRMAARIYNTQHLHATGHTQRSTRVHTTSANAIRFLLLAKYSSIIIVYFLLLCTVKRHRAFDLTTSLFLLLHL